MLGLEGSLFASLYKKVRFAHDGRKPALLGAILKD